MDQSSGTVRRMRKGTKSCLPCQYPLSPYLIVRPKMLWHPTMSLRDPSIRYDLRALGRRRKTRCSLPGRDGGPCAECAARGDRCTLQGVVGNGGDDTLTTNQRLKERVIQLEARLVELERSQKTPIPSTGTVDALSNLLLSIQDSAATSSARSSFSPPLQPHDEASNDDADDDQNRNVHDDEAEESIDGAAAPLMLTLNNAILGCAKPAKTSPFPLASPTASSAQPLVLRTKPSCRNPAKHRAALRDLCAQLPSLSEIQDICARKSSWWPLFRTALGLVWGGDEAVTLASVATTARQRGDPAEMGLLLASFAIATGDRARFLPAVERRIVADDEYAGGEAGLHCLMAVGLAYFGALQARRAWMVFRRANALLQLRGWHAARRRDSRQDTLFWQFFHADRWCSLMIGLPYMMPDHLCEVGVEAIETLGPAMFLYHHLALLTGRVIDCLQNTQGPSLAAALQVEEQMEAVRAKLPPAYLSMASIKECADTDEKNVRLYRVVHYYQLKAYVHLPFLLRSGQESHAESHGRYEYSRKACIDDSRQLLHAYLEIAAYDPQAVYDGMITTFTAFVAAVVLLLSLLGYGRPRSTDLHAAPTPQMERDWKSLYRAMDVMRNGAHETVSALLCKTCFEALQSLVASARAVDGDDVTKKVVLPYFGTIDITRCGPYFDHHTEQGEVPDFARPTTVPSAHLPTGSTAVEDTPMDMNFGVDMSFAYHGPFLPEANAQGEGYSSLNVPMSGVDWDVTDWSWLTTELPSIV